jgi:hypothetical protein
MTRLSRRQALLGGLTNASGRVLQMVEQGELTLAQEVCR